MNASFKPWITKFLPGFLFKNLLETILINISFSFTLTVRYSWVRFCNYKQWIYFDSSRTEAFGKNTIYRSILFSYMCYVCFAFRVNNVIFIKKIKHNRPVALYWFRTHYNSW